MEYLLLVSGWLLWVFTLVYAVGKAVVWKKDPLVRSLMRIQAFLLLSSCASTIVFPLSRLWLLAAAPLAILLPLLLIGLGARNVDTQLAALKSESLESGIPLENLIQSEKDRTKPF